MSAIDAPATDDVLAFEREFDAPRELVYRLWADPAHRLRWWGPEGMALRELATDFRPGGAWSMAMEAVDGHQHRVSGRFREIEPPSRLSFTYINATDNHETLVELDFIARGLRTLMRFRQAPFVTHAERAGHAWGWNSTFDLLSGYLKRIGQSGLPDGPPRIDGVAEDIRAARERMEAEVRVSTAERAVRGDGLTRR